MMLMGLLTGSKNEAVSAMEVQANRNGKTGRSLIGRGAGMQRHSRQAKSLILRYSRNPNLYACPLPWYALDSDRATHLRNPFLY